MGKNRNKQHSYKTKAYLKERQNKRREKQRRVDATFSDFLGDYTESFDVFDVDLYEEDDYAEDYD